MTAWEPGGLGLDPISLGIVADRDAVVHLRLVAADRYPIAACCGSGCAEWTTWGQLWTGLSSEVNCPDCLEWVHA